MTDEEPMRVKEREISILVAREGVTLTHARCPAGDLVAGPHVRQEAHRCRRRGGSSSAM
jgi:hypothetical protein